MAWIVGHYYNRATSINEAVMIWERDGFLKLLSIEDGW